MRKRILAIGAICLAVSLAVDRAALYVWQKQVFRFYRDINDAIQSGRATPGPGNTGSVAYGTETFLVMPKAEGAPARYVTLRTDRFLLRVASVTVDGVGNVHLRFLPPSLAWTTRLLPRSSYTHHGDPTDVDTRYHYQFKLDVLVDSAGSESVSLQRGEYHFAPALKESELRPRWFY